MVVRLLVVAEVEQEGRELQLRPPVDHRVLSESRRRALLLTDSSCERAHRHGSGPSGGGCFVKGKLVSSPRVGHERAVS